jgi:hypothetical protein
VTGIADLEDSRIVDANDVAGERLFDDAALALRSLDTHDWRGACP